MFGLALVRCVSSPACAYTHKNGERVRRRERERETEHTCSHLLQSKGSLNIRGAAYPLLPCVKPFTRMCRESWGTGATAVLIELHSVRGHDVCARMLFLWCGLWGSPPPYSENHESDGKGQTHSFYLPVSLPLGHYRKRCIRTMETCCVTAECWEEAELQGLFEFQSLT